MTRPEAAVRRSPRRGRGKSVLKTAQTRLALTKAALDLFLERGFADTRMGDVAARAGLAKGTCYLYFPTKEALFEGVLREAISEPVALVTMAAEQYDEDPRQFLSRIVTPILRDLEQSRRGALVRLIVTEGARFPSLSETYRRVVLDPAMAGIRVLARRAQARGDLRSDAIHRYPQLLGMPAAMSTIWNGLFRSEPLDAADVFEAYLDLIFGPSSAGKAG